MSHEYRQNIRLDAYDAFNPFRRDAWTFTRDGRPQLRLFGPEHIGDTTRSNILVANSLVADYEIAVIHDITARSNVPTSIAHDDALMRAWHAWTTSTTVTVVLGTAPIAETNLDRIMWGGPGQMTMDSTDEVMLDAVAGVFRAEAEDRGELHSAEHWRHVAADAMWLLSRPRIMAPGRQIFRVVVESDRSALGALLELQPPAVAPECLVWISAIGSRVWSHQTARSAERCDP